MARSNSINHSSPGRSSPISRRTALGRVAGAGAALALTLPRSVGIRTFHFIATS